MTDAPDSGRESSSKRSSNRSSAGSDHWLVRPSTIRKLWWIFGAVLVLTVAAQLFVHVHGYFGIDEWPGFNAGYGFLACVAMVVFAKLLGFALKRPVDYYDDPPRLSPDVDDD